MFRQSFLAVPLPLLILFVLALPAAADVWYVPVDAPTIQAGIDSAKAGDEVVVACGSYLEHSLQMKPGVWLRSEAGDPGCVVIDAQSQGRVLSCIGTDNSTLIEAVTLTNGLANEPYPFDLGGGLFCENASPQITRCIFANNQGNYGGGAYLKDGSSPTFSECIFIANHSETMGGGLFCFNSSSPSLVGCTFSSNSAVEDGGGLYCSTSSTATVTACTFYANQALLGGGISCFNQSVCTLETVLIVFSPEGQACHYDVGSTPLLTCCDLYGNFAGDWIGSLSAMLGIDGNIAADPLFCADEPHAQQDWTIANVSPCAAEQSACGLIGAWDVGCTTTPMAPATWGGVKARYRSEGTGF